MGNFEEIKTSLSNILSPLGFSIHPFKISWYNELVQKKDEAFKLPYHDDCIAFIIISTPSVFEKAFIPFVRSEHYKNSSSDPLDQCMNYYFSLVKETCLEEDVDVLYDYELTATRRPKILVQTAGHCSGAAYYYQKSDVKTCPWPETKSIYGVSIHPKFGGWFAYRGVIVFKNLLYSNLPKLEPIDVLLTDEKKIEALEKFNGNWKDWAYRDVVEVVERYSELQKQYFITPPKDRYDLIRRIREGLS
ncbi:DgyrCDS970 [Dimorphilus gyrociliatus]|uniref:Cyanocobalamin reductase (cyanide-eliminating) n=1 Tax=Dimorphilus gyrociliatus TaxID=2664684 RepID=A0A7I8V5V2_9ANNE|nr:DgyrCDS970 [Dimorphilus gyrociliatus]